MNLSKYIDDLQKKGKSSFTFKEVKEVFGGPSVNIRARIRTQKKKGVIVSPLRGIYIIVPIEHRTLGSLPPKDLLPVAMEYLGAPYYVGLLTAAAHHGATHQPVHVFQVVTNKRIRNSWILGGTCIRFFYKKDCLTTKTVQEVVKTGYLPVSSPEETAKDIMTYYRQSGGLNHQATVLSELIEAMDTRALIQLAHKSKSTFWIQRMGYILGHIDPMDHGKQEEIIQGLSELLQRRKFRYIPLAPELPIKDKPRDNHWKIIENTTVESDI